MVIIVLCSYALFDMDGNQVPSKLVREVGEAFESILEEESIVFCFFLFSFFSFVLFTYDSVSNYDA